MSPHYDGAPVSGDEADILAAEFVLGLLDAPDEARAAERVRQDKDFAARVEQWRARFSELDITAPEGAAHAALLARIEHTLDSETAAAAPVKDTARVSDDPAMRARTKVVPSGGAPQGWTVLAARLWDSLGFWRMSACAGAAASLLLALTLALVPPRLGPQPQLVAVLLGPQGEPAAVVNAYADGTADLVPLRSISVPDGRVLEVWTLQDAARGPVSIGLTSEARRIPLDLKSLPRTGPNQLFEITLEPRGGSPIGRPTGPILMKGTTSVAL